MNCAQAQDLMGRLLSDEHTVDEEKSLREHFASCPTCAEALRQEQFIHDELQQLGRLGGSAAERVASRTIAALNSATVTGSRKLVSPKRSTGNQLAVVCVLVVMVAVGWGLMRNAQVVSVVDNRPSSGSVRQPPVIANVQGFVGEVEARRAGSTEWQPVSVTGMNPFACSGGDALRTLPGAACEVVTACGNVIRLNQQSEVSLISATDVSLVAGEVWCQAPPDCELNVLANINPPMAASAEAMAIFTCPAETACVTSLQGENSIQIASLFNELDAGQMSPGLQPLSSRTFQSSTNGTRVETLREDSPQALAWMLPLLKLKPAGDPEVAQWVDRLIAQLGETKVSYLSEQQIRALGPAGTIPLIHFVEKSTSPDDAARSRRAMELVRELAPESATLHLINLLSADDGIVRRLAAQTLLRLHGKDFGISPADWEAGGEVAADGVRKWRAEHP